MKREERRVRGKQTVIEKERQWTKETNSVRRRNRRRQRKRDIARNKQREIKTNIKKG